jgi:hypothetical protein
MNRVDAAGNSWFEDRCKDLQQQDFIWYACMQTARRMSDRASRRLARHDRVLDRLLAEGTFDREGSDMPDVREEFAMAHSAAMVNRCLMRIESLEGEVFVLTICDPDSN